MRSLARLVRSLWQWSSIEPVRSGRNWPVWCTWRRAKSVKGFAKSVKVGVWAGVILGWGCLGCTSVTKGEVAAWSSRFMIPGANSAGG